MIHERVISYQILWKQIPYILKSNMHPFYSFRGPKSWVRIRFAVESWILEKWYSRCTCRKNNTLQSFIILFITYYSSDSPSSLIRCSRTFWGYCLLALLASVSGGLWACVMSLNTQRNSRTVGDVGLSAETFKWETVKASLHEASWEAGQVKK
jgi:hypothetical protein